MPDNQQDDAAQLAADKAAAADAEKAKAKTDAKTQEKGTKVVRYTGTADERIISAQAFKNVGVEDQSQLSWSKKNHFEIPVSDISAGALRYLDEDDDGFEIVTV